MKTQTAKISSVILSLALLIALGDRAAASSLASDSAADAAYNAGWVNGSNGGFGWGSAWIFTQGTTASYFTGDSATNGDGDTNPPIGDINSAGRAWGLNSGTGSPRADRLFNGALGVGQTFHLNMDNGLPISGVVGFSLINAQGNQVWQFSITGGSTTYDIFAQSGFMNTGIAATDEGLDISFTLTSLTTYSASIAVLGGAPTVFTGGLYNEATGQDVAGVRFFDVNGGTSAAQTLFFNNMAIVPEPSTITLLGVGALAGLATLRRRKTQR